MEIKLAVKTAEGAFVGPNRARNQLWTLLSDTSYKRGGWLRPVTGCKAKPAEIREWEQATPQTTFIISVPKSRPLRLPARTPPSRLELSTADSVVLS